MLAILSSIKAQEEGKTAPQQPPPSVSTVKEVTKKPTADNKYDRFNQESQSRNIQKGVYRYIVFLIFIIFHIILSKVTYCFKSFER